MIAQRERRNETALKIIAFNAINYDVKELCHLSVCPVFAHRFYPVARKPIESFSRKRMTPSPKIICLTLYSAVTVPCCSGISQKKRAPSV